jgi:hypothetical protein
MDRSAKVAVGAMLSMVLVVSISALLRRDSQPPAGSPSPFAAPAAAAEDPSDSDPLPEATPADAR